MKYPTREQCLGFYKEINTPENIINHVMVVNKIAVFLAKKLKEKKVKIDLKLVDAASLLHDLDKWLCINDKTLRHGIETEKILKEKGFPEIGFYAKQHIAEFLKEDATWEEKIICYADKRVLDVKIVSLKKRFDYINQRYPPKDPKQRKDAIEDTYRIEKEIMEKIGMDADELDKLLFNGNA
jgi:putative nucleotidyltransferase with HDIG domain